MKPVPEENPIHEGVINRFHRTTDVGPDEEDCEYVWHDRLTGDEVFRYDAADPANRPPLGPSDEEWLANKGMDIHEEIPVARCHKAPAPSEVAAYAWRQAQRAEREQEIERGEELLADTDLYSYLEIAASALSFNSGGREGPTYRDDEEKIIKPALERKGFSRISFFMGEQDSFGPLSRGIRAWKDDKGYIFYYG